MTLDEFKANHLDAEEQDELEDTALLFALGRVLDKARRDHHELVFLRGEHEKIKADYAESINSSFKAAQVGTRNALLMALAISGGEGRDVAKKIINQDEK